MARYDNKPKNVLTKKQLEQIKAALAENPDMKLKDMIEKFSLTITLSGLCHRLKRANIPYNERSKLTSEQNSRLMEALTKNPETPLDELIEELLLPITPYKLRRKLIRDGVWPNAGTVLTKAPTEQTQQVPLTTKPYNVAYAFDKSNGNVFDEWVFNFQRATHSPPF